MLWPYDLRWEKVKAQAHSQNFLGRSGGILPQKNGFCFFFGVGFICLYFLGLERVIICLNKFANDLFPKKI